MEMLFGVLSDQGEVRLGWSDGKYYAALYDVDEQREVGRGTGDYPEEAAAELIRDLVGAAFGASSVPGTPDEGEATDENAKDKGI